MKKVITATAFALAAGPLVAQEVALPDRLAWTAYGTGSAGYNQSVAIGAALQEATGIQNGRGQCSARCTFGRFRHRS